MRSFAIAGLLSFATPCLSAPVNLPINLVDGAAWTIESARVRVDEVGDATQRKESGARYQASYRAGAHGAVLTLKPVGGSFYGEVVGAPALSRSDLPLDLDVDARLNPIRARNWSALRMALLALLDAPHASGPSTDLTVGDAARTFLRSLPDERAPGIMFPPLYYLGLGQGRALEPGRPQPYEDQVQNVFTGAPIKTRGSFLLDRLDPVAQRATVVWTQAPDPESLANSVREANKAMIASTGPSGRDDAGAKAVGQMSAMSRLDSCRFEIDVPSGLAVRTECESMIAMSTPGEPEARSTTTWTITQTLPENH